MGKKQSNFDSKDQTIKPFETISDDDAYNNSSDTESVVSNFIIDDTESVVSNFIIDDTESVVSNFIIDDTESVVSNFIVDDRSVVTENIDSLDYTIDEYLISRLPKQVMLWTGEMIDIDGDNLELVKYYLYKNKWLSPEEMIPLGQPEVIHYQSVDDLSGVIYDKLIDNMKNNMKSITSFFT